MAVISDQTTKKKEGVRPKAPRARRRQGWWLPYVLLAPAVVLELVIHVVPMLTGIYMSFLKLTKFFIANWAAAPFAGLRN